MAQGPTAERKPLKDFADIDFDKFIRNRNVAAKHQGIHNAWIDG